MPSTPEAEVERCRSIKCVVVGDSDVGKTSLLSRYCRRVFPVRHVPTIFDDDTATVMAGDERVQLMLYDTTGQTEYNRMRFITYPGTDVIIVCFSVVRASSLTSVQDRWLPELDALCPHSVPIILVGTQTDLRPSAAAAADQRRCRGGPPTAADTVATVSREQGARMAKRIGAHQYVECSALNGDGLIEVFAAAAKAGVDSSGSSRRRRRRSSSCGRSTPRHIGSAAKSLVCWWTSRV